MKKIGIIIGKFFPLHIGHVNFIQRASGIVDRLYVVISYSDDADDLLTSNSRFVKEITPKDRLRFVKQTFKNQPNLLNQRENFKNSLFRRKKLTIHLLT